MPSLATFARRAALRPLHGLPDTWEHRNSPGAAWLDRGIYTVARALYRRGFVPTWSCSGLWRDHAGRGETRRSLICGYVTVQTDCWERLHRLQSLVDGLGFFSETTPGTGRWDFCSPQRWVVADGCSPTLPQLYFHTPHFSNDEVQCVMYRRLVTQVVRCFPLLDLPSRWMLSA